MRKQKMFIFSYKQFPSDTVSALCLTARVTGMKSFSTQLGTTLSAIPEVITGCTISLTLSASTSCSCHSKKFNHIEKLDRKLCFHSPQFSVIQSFQIPMSEDPYLMNDCLCINLLNIVRLFEKVPGKFNNKFNYQTITKNVYSNWKTTFSQKQDFLKILSALT